MEELRTILIDDEQHCLDTLKTMLLPYNEEIKIIGEFSSVEAAYEGIVSLSPQLVFLDVELNNDTCFSLLERFERIDFDIIFITAYESYALKAFKLLALDFILKPVGALEIVQAINKLKTHRFQKLITSQYKILLQNIASKGQDVVFPIETLSEIELIKVSDIIRIDADEAYSDIILSDTRKIKTSKRIGHYEDILSHLNFFRIHKSHIINLKHIVKYYRGKGGSVLMTDKSSINVAERRKADFLKIIKRVI